HAARQVHPRKTETVSAIERNAAARQIEQMLVHADQARNHGVISEIQALRARRDRDLARVANSLNFSVSDDDGLVVTYGGACSIDHADMGQSDYRRAHAQKG